MLTEPLPATLDVRNAAARELTVSGTLELRRMTRLLGGLATESGRVESVCAFGRDGDNRHVVTVTVDARVEVLCQRCLEVVAVDVRTEQRLGIVGSDEMARQLPAHLEPWVVEKEPADLWALVEDEVILGLPIVSYHDSERCGQLLDDYRRPSQPEAAADNPFKMLEQLKSSKQIR